MWQDPGGAQPGLLGELGCAMPQILFPRSEEARLWKVRIWTGSALPKPGGFVPCKTRSRYISASGEDRYEHALASRVRINAQPIARVAARLASERSLASSNARQNLNIPE